MISQSGRQAEALQALDGDEAGDDTGRSVEIAAIGDRIEMRSGHEARCTSVLACQGHEEVGGVIAACLEPHGVGVGGDQLVCELLALAIGIARDSLAILAARPQGIEERDNVQLLGHHSVADF